MSIWLPTLDELMKTKIAGFFEFSVWSLLCLPDSMCLASVFLRGWFR